MGSEDETVIEISSLQPPVKAKKITRKRLLAGVTIARWPLLWILAFQALFSWILLQNTAFQDEALYVYAGRQIWQAWLGGPPLYDPYSYYFSGDPYFYPLIGGALDRLGGLELARAFSLLCMLLVTICGYYVTKKLFNQRSAVFAALFFVSQGPVLFLNRLATYDPLCLCLLAVGITLAVNAGLARRPWRALGIGPVLVLAFVAKYVALLFIPSALTALLVCTLLRWGWRSMLLRGALGVLSLAVAGTLLAFVMIHFDPRVLHAIGATTTNRVIEQKYSRLGLTENVAEIVGLSYALGLAGFVFAPKKHRLLALLFLGSSLLIPTYHIYKAEMISLDKHLGFGMFFAMPVAGYALASLSSLRGRFLSGRYWLASVAICLILLQLGAQKAQFMYSSWPSTTRLVYVFQTQVRPANGHYLAEQVEVLRYALENETYSWQWSGPYFFEYTDKQGHYSSGDEAYLKAVNDGYFDLIELNFDANVRLDLLIAQAIERSKQYTLIAKIPNWDAYGSNYFFVWHKM